jgi:recombination protein RecA
MSKKKSLKVLSERDLLKKYPMAGAATELLPTDHTIWLPTKCLPLNWALGGGIPYGRLLEIFGFESTGKSLLAIDFGYSTQALGGIILWDDAENSWTNQWAEQNELDSDRVIVYGGNDIEGFSDWHRDLIIHYRSQLTNNEPILVVIDSLAALDCLENIGADALNSKAQMGNRAKAIYRMYRERMAFYKKYGVCVIGINQVRNKLGSSMFESSETTPGGQATRFYASQRLALVRSKQIKGRILKSGAFKEDKIKGYKVGQNIILQVAKNKVAPPRNSIRTKVYFLPDVKHYVGIDKYEGLLDILIDSRVVKQKGNRYYYKGKQICHGKDSFIEVIENDDKLRKRLIIKSKINTISRTQRKLDNIDKNLYPVKIKSKKDEE